MTLLTMSALIRIVCSTSVIIIVVIIWAKTATHLIVGLQLPALENPHIMVNAFKCNGTSNINNGWEKQKAGAIIGGYKLSSTSFLGQNFATAERHWWSCPQMPSRCWLALCGASFNSTSLRLMPRSALAEPSAKLHVRSGFCSMPSWWGGGGGGGGGKKKEKKTLIFFGKKEKGKWGYFGGVGGGGSPGGVCEGKNKTFFYIFFFLTVCVS